MVADTQLCGNNRVMTDIGAGHYSVNHYSQVILEVLVHGQLACMIAMILKKSMLLRLHGSKFVLLLAIVFISILCMCMWKQKTFQDA